MATTEVTELVQVASNILFCNNEVGFKALSITANKSDLGSRQSYQPIFNLISKNRSACIQYTVTNASPLQLVWYVGSTGISINYLILSNAKKIAQVSTGFVLAGSTNGSTYTTITSFTLTPSSTYIGVLDNDYAVPFSSTSAYNYFRITFTPASTVVMPISSIYMGTFFDTIEDPEEIEPELARNNSTWKTDNGNSYFYESLDKECTYRLFYKGITETVLNNFITNIYQRSKKHGVYLASADASLLNDNSLIHGDIISFKYSKLWNDYYTIDMLVKELF